MKTMLAALGVLLATQTREGCDPPKQRPLEPGEHATFISELTYVKDDRVGICYAVKASRTHNGYMVQAFTAVPCDKVEILTNQKIRCQ